MANIGDMVHYVLPGGRCRPAIIVETGASVAAQRAVDAALRALSDAQQAQANAQAQVKASATAVSAAQQSASAATVAPGRSTSVAVLTTSATERLTLAKQLVDALAAQAKAGDALAAASGDVANAQANADAAQKALAPAADVLDMQVLLAGQQDRMQVSEAIAIRADSAPPVVLRSAVKHEAVPVAGTWHSREECAL